MLPSIGFEPLTSNSPTIPYATAWMIGSAIQFIKAAFSSKHSKGFGKTNCLTIVLITVINKYNFPNNMSFQNTSLSSLRRESFVFRLVFKMQNGFYKFKRKDTQIGIHLNVNSPTIILNPIRHIVLGQSVNFHLCIFN